MRIIAESMTNWLRNTQPHVALLISAAVGVALCAGSGILGIQDLHVTTSANVCRQVGYFQSVNWSINYTIVFPLTVFFVLGAFQAIPRALRGLHTRGMVWNVAAKRFDDSGVLAQAATELTRSRAWLISFGVGLALLVSYAEASFDNIAPLLRNAPDANNTAIDWGEAAFIIKNTSWPFRIANAGFDLLAFSTQAASLAVILVFFFYFVDLASNLERFVQERGLLIVPDVRASDRRLGFEALENPLEQLLYASLGAFVMCYLSRIVKLYFSTTQYADLWSFMKNDFGRGLTTDLSKVLTVSALEPGAATNFFALLVVVAGFVLVALVALIIVFVLRRLALDGAGTIRQWAEENPAGRWQGIGAADVQKKLDTMQVWPMGHPSLNVFVLGVVLGLLALVFYHLVFIVAGYEVLAMVLKVVPTKRGQT